jgi:hypothetical protein
MDEPGGDPFMAEIQGLSARRVGRTWLADARTVAAYCQGG